MPIRLPLRIEVLEEAVKVVDALGMAVSYVYICQSDERRQQTHRLTRAEGIEVAQVIARAVTERLERDDAEA